MSRPAAREEDDQHLAYGEYHGQGAEADPQDRGFIGDIYHRIKTSSSQSQDQGSGQSPQQQSGTSAGGMSSFFKNIQGQVDKFGADVKTRLAGSKITHSHTHHSGECTEGAHAGQVENRYDSFAPQRPSGNNAKWYVDGCSYMWAVSIALEQAQESIWILDWWLSPELYLRRPPSRNEQYRIDNLLKAAADRGVKVNIIVYKEVTQALTRKYLNPWLPEYLQALLPHDIDGVTRALTQMGLFTIFASLEHVEKTEPLISPPLTVSSSHTKHHLEDLSPNIAVVRHPDHLPDQQTIAASIKKTFSDFKLTAASASKLPGDTLAAIYGVQEDTVLYWAHHEKLCLVDGKIAFMGGLDLCYGRWDTNQHSIADAHPGDVSQIVFPGQDYNNSRIMDFQDVTHWENNQLVRTESSRMGWSDIALSLRGEAVEDLKEHFVQRWNFIFEEKYHSRSDPRYTPLVHNSSLGGYQMPGESVTGADDINELGHRFKDKLKMKVQDVENRFEGNYGGHHQQQPMQQSGYDPIFPSSNISCQILRSSAKWSHGHALEHSIANAYIEIIKNSEHFVYIENQFFITATVEEQKPIKNRIGAAIVERILRAARSGQKYKMIVLMPAVPAFAGDLRADDSLGTRAIMEFQYDSISRGGHSIYETIAKAGYNPLDYIRFYNLRNYDRINVSSAMRAAEQQSGVPYEEARKGHDALYGGGFQQGSQQEGYGDQPQARPGAYDSYQQGAQQIGNQQGLGSGRWDSVAECYMLNGEDIRNVPWTEGNVAEIDAFVTEELYIHSKLLIADDRVVLCGSANLNDRSQLGDHDSEIAIVIEDRETVASRMGGQPYQASKFAAGLRREIFRKHMGLLKAQDYSRPTQNYLPITSGPNEYDWGSYEDNAVADPLDEEFTQRWNDIAQINTEVFSKVFHNVPNDNVKNWKEYETWYENLFRAGDPKDPKKPAGPYKVGHVVREEFPGGVAEVKDWLSRVRGNLVEMPLLFLKEEDIAKEGVSFNAFTAEVYT